MSEYKRFGWCLEGLEDSADARRQPHPWPSLQCPGYSVNVDVPLRVGGKTELGRITLSAFNARRSPCRRATSRTPMLSSWTATTRARRTCPLPSANAFTPSNGSCQRADALTTVIARASACVGSPSGLAYIASLCGVKSMTLYSDRRHWRYRAELVDSLCSGIGAASMTSLDIDYLPLLSAIAP